MYMDEEDAFWAVHILLTDPKYAMHGLYKEGTQATLLQQQKLKVIFRFPQAHPISCASRQNLNETTA